MEKQAFNGPPNGIKKIIMLSSPYGFSNMQKEIILTKFVQVLEDLGAEVWEGFKRGSRVDLTQKGWAYKIGQSDLNDVKNADAIFVILNGQPPDEGCMIELGAAIALGKKTFLFRDDSRLCCDCEDYPLNLMLFAGLPADDWQDYYYTSFDDLTRADRALAKWLSD